MKEPNLYVDERLRSTFIQLVTNRSDDDADNELNALASSNSNLPSIILPTSIDDARQANLDKHIIESSSEFEFTNKIALDYIWPTFPIGFLLLGTVANLLSIIVFRRREMKKFSSFCYFFYLNCINLAVLYVTMVRVIGEFNFQVDIRRLSLFTCKIHVFLTYFLGHLSSMLLCSISIDRVISVMFLHRAKLLCTPRVAAWVTCALVVFNFLLSSHFLVFESGYTKPKETQAETLSTHVVSPQHHNLSKSLNHVAAVAESLVSGGNIPDTATDTSRNDAVEEYIVVCDPVPDTIYAIVVHDVWKIIDMIIYAFIPFTIMLICSVIIIGRVAQQSKKFKKNKKKPSTTQTAVLKNNRAMSKDRAMSNLSDDLISATNNAVTTTTQKSTGDHQKSNEAARMSARTRNLALMLIPVNFLFLAFLAPVVIAMYTYDQLWDDKLTLAIIELLSYCNFTINFFIYFLTSSKFREEFFKFIDEVCKRKVGGFSGGGNNNASTATNKTTIIRNGDNNKSTGIRRPPERV